MKLQKNDHNDHNDCSNCEACGNSRCIRISRPYIVTVSMFFIVLVSFLFYKAETDIQPKDVRKYTESQFNMIHYDLKEMHNDLESIYEELHEIEDKLFKRNEEKLSKE